MSAMRILITGSSGMVGSALTPFLKRSGHDVIPIAREKGRAGTIFWDPAAGEVDLEALEGADAVVHLAGENIASGRWTAARKDRIKNSRVQGTRLLAESLGRLQRPPGVLVSASAIGYYGDRGSEVLTEESAPGKGFLPDVCRLWESATDAATRKGIRVVHARIGIILSSKGGALPKMALPFRLGAGGRIGSGEQYMSWIALDDVCGVILHAIVATGLHGPVNTVSPVPIKNRDFTRILGGVLSRPAIFPLPAFVARVVLGEMADELLLAGGRVEPAKLQATRYGFRHRDLEKTLRELFEK